MRNNENICHFERLKIECLFTNFNNICKQFSNIKKEFFNW